MKKIILASKSIDRGELLGRSKSRFEVLITNVNEEEYKKEFSEPLTLVKELAKAKAENARERLKQSNKEAIIIAADTIVELEGKIIGKAKNEEEAYKILKKLTGQTHNLITGIAIGETTSNRMIIDYDSTSVQFLKLTIEEIQAYIKTGEWKGRAGAYSIRDRASLFIKSVNGSPSNVIGLPMQKIFKILKEDFNLNLLLDY
ncbi:MAG: Maf family protein [Promethearchaeota archaeon]